MTMNLKKCMNELLLLGSEDWVHTPDIVSIVIEYGEASTDDEIREMSLALIREAVLQGLMVVGDVTRAEAGFRKWNMSPEESVERVEREWRALKSDRVTGHSEDGKEWRARSAIPEIPGEICWLWITEKGTEIAMSIWEQRKQE